MKQKKEITLASTLDCTACAACVSVCPKGCISMVEDKEGFLQPEIDTKQCILCHKCEKTCPILNTESISDDFETRAYAVINRDDEIRAQSSSGGVFFSIAEWVIKQGGVVFGARWNEKWEVVHDYAENIEGVKAFMRSKYVQSVVGDTLKQAKKFLDSGRWVLYSGTPCQLGGLRSYLGKEYEKLIQVDLICHGVPSPGVWRSYFKDFHSQKKVLDVNFRDKRDGWFDSQCFRIKYHEGEYRTMQGNDSFFKGFLYDIYLRKSCYKCQYRSYHRETDVTIGDFWGVDLMNTNVYDNKGTSIIFVHTKKGQTIVNKSLPDFIIEEQLKEQAIRRNLVFVQNIKEPDGRFAYFVFFKFLGFKKSIFAISTDGLITRIKRKIKKMITKYM